MKRKAILLLSLILLLSFSAMGAAAQTNDNIVDIAAKLSPPVWPTRWLRPMLSTPSSPPPTPPSAIWTRLSCRPLWPTPRAR